MCSLSQLHHSVISLNIAAAQGGMFVRTYFGYTAIQPAYVEKIEFIKQVDDESLDKGTERGALNPNLIFLGGRGEGEDYVLEAMIKPEASTEFTRHPLNKVLGLDLDQLVLPEDASEKRSKKDAELLFQKAVASRLNWANEGEVWGVCGLKSYLGHDAFLGGFYLGHDSDSAPSDSRSMKSVTTMGRLILHGPYTDSQRLYPGIQEWRVKATRIDEFYYFKLKEAVYKDSDRQLVFLPEGAILFGTKRSPTAHLEMDHLRIPVASVKTKAEKKYLWRDKLQGTTLLRSNASGEWSYIVTVTFPFVALAMRSRYTFTLSKTVSDSEVTVFERGASRSPKTAGPQSAADARGASAPPRRGVKFGFWFHTAHDTPVSISLDRYARYGGEQGIFSRFGMKAYNYWATMVVESARLYEYADHMSFVFLFSEYSKDSGYRIRMSREGSIHEEGKLWQRGRMRRVFQAYLISAGFHDIVQKTKYQTALISEVHGILLGMMSRFPKDMIPRDSLLGDLFDEVLTAETTGFYTAETMDFLLQQVELLKTHRPEALEICATFQINMSTWEKTARDRKKFISVRDSFVCHEIQEIDEVLRRADAEAREVLSAMGVLILLTEDVHLSYLKLQGAEAAADAAGFSSKPAHYPQSQYPAKSDGSALKVMAEFCAPKDGDSHHDAGYKWTKKSALLDTGCTGREHGHIRRRFVEKLGAVPTRTGAVRAITQASGEEECVDEEIVEMCIRLKNQAPDIREERYFRSRFTFLVKDECACDVILGIRMISELGVGFSEPLTADNMRKIDPAACVDGV